VTTFDAKGLPQFATSDKIAATGDGLREDLNLLSATASAAITVEGSRAEGAAKSYADSKDTDNRSAWAAADTTTLNSAKSYADGKFVPFWKANTAYVAGQQVAAPNGDIVSAKANFTSGATYSATNWNASAQDGRLGALEAKQAVKCVRLEAGRWIWDVTAAATHYLIPDETGQPVIRQTPWPMPLPDPTIPALNW